MLSFASKFVWKLFVLPREKYIQSVFANGLGDFLWGWGGVSFYALLWHNCLLYSR